MSEKMKHQSEGMWRLWVGIGVLVLPVLFYNFFIGETPEHSQQRMLRLDREIVAAWQIFPTWIAAALSLAGAIYSFSGKPILQRAKNAIGCVAIAVLVIWAFRISVYS